LTRYLQQVTEKQFNHHITQYLKMFFQSANFIKEPSSTDKFIQLVYPNGDRYYTLNVCQNKKIVLNKTVVEIYQEGNKSKFITFATTQEARAGFAILNNIVDSLRDNCVTASFGQEIVTESRDFNSGDANKLLAIKSDDITLSMPSVNPFGKGDLVGIKNINDYKNTHIILKEGDDPILIGDEVFIIDLIDIGGGIYVPQPLTGIISDENGENAKSITRYLYDQSQNAIPLSGTASGSPVTGDIELITGYGETRIFKEHPDENWNGRIAFTESAIQIISESTDGSQVAGIEYTKSATRVIGTASSVGITGAFDYTANITDLDYPQKKYVDSAIAAIKPYKVYTAIITQTGTDAPTAVVLQNTLGITPTLTRFATGNYRITASNTFTANKTFCIVGQEANSGTGMNYIWASDSNDDEVLLQTYDGAGLGAALTDDKMDRLAVEIRVYK